MYKTKTQTNQYIPKNVEGKPNNTIKNNNNNHTLSYEEIRKIIENKQDKEIVRNTEEKNY